MFHLFFQEEEYHEKPLPIEPCCVDWPCFCSRFPGSALNEVFEPPSSLEVMPRVAVRKTIVSRWFTENVFSVEAIPKGAFKCWISSINSDAEVNDIHLHVKLEDFSYSWIAEESPRIRSDLQRTSLFQSRDRPTQTTNQQLKACSY